MKCAFQMLYLVGLGVGFGTLGQSPPLLETQFLLLNEGFGTEPQENFAAGHVPGCCI